MDGFYDGDLKDIWDSDLDPTESLKISTDPDLHDWFMERDMKDPAVMILNDKLMSDALFNTPIKTEHSYSLNSDGDSLPDSPHSLQTKMDDMEDECYPAISLKTATSNPRTHVDIASVDPKCLAISVDCDVAPMELAPFVTSSSGGFTKTANTLLTTTSAAASTSSATATTLAATRPTVASLPLRSNHASIYASLSKIASAPMTFNLRHPEQNGGGGTTTTITLGKQSTAQQQQQQQQQQQYLPQQVASMYEQSDCCTPTSIREGSTSPDLYSDIEIDESCIKDEPMSPDSSCPPSPHSQERLTMAKISYLEARTNADLVMEHKNGCLQLTPASQNLLKAQQLTVSATTATNPHTIIPKYHVKPEATLSSGTFITGVATAKHGNSAGVGGGQYGLPLTPPSSSSSDDSEAAAPAISVSSVRRSASSSSSSSPSSASSSSCLSAAGRNVGSGGSTRQPIHTPLISSQPKGSTGTLILTEEEKRTLQAEGYPIPQKLPLTKAEEKSLKKIRRKIKNKISAQESRRKKKEYMDQLERRVEILVNENNEQRKRVETLEHSNANLLSQLHKLQALLNKQNVKKN